MKKQAMAWGLLWLSLASYAGKDNDPTQDDRFKEFDSLTRVLKDGKKPERGKIYRLGVNRPHPCQAGAGFAEIDGRAEKVSKKGKKELLEYLKEKMPRVVIAPGGRPWLINGHHLDSAFSRLGYQSFLVVVEADLSKLTPARFKRELVRRKWVWLKVWKRGRPHDYPVMIDVDDLPDRIEDLKDDPFRSLAWAVKNRGGFRESNAPFQQFLWADFFHEHFDERDLEKDWDGVLDQCLKLARSAEARRLPGFVGRAKKKSRCSRALATA